MASFFGPEESENAKENGKRKQQMKHFVSLLETKNYPVVLLWFF